MLLQYNDYCNFGFIVYGILEKHVLNRVLSTHYLVDLYGYTSILFAFARFESIHDATKIGNQKP